MLRFHFYKVRPGKLEKLKSWSQELKRREDEVRATFVQEKVKFEGFYLFEEKGVWFAAGLQKTEKDFTPADLSVPLNKQHLDILKECLESIKFERLYEFYLNSK